MMIFDRSKRPADPSTVEPLKEDDYLPPGNRGGGVNNTDQLSAYINAGDWGSALIWVEHLEDHAHEKDEGHFYMGGLTLAYERAEKVGAMESRITNLILARGELSLKNLARYVRDQADFTDDFYEPRLYPAAIRNCAEYVIWRHRSYDGALDFDSIELIQSAVRSIYHAPPLLPGSRKRKSGWHETGLGFKLFVGELPDYREPDDFIPDNPSEFWWQIPWQTYSLMPYALLTAAVLCDRHHRAMIYSVLRELKRAARYMTSGFRCFGPGLGSPAPVLSFDGTKVVKFSYDARNLAATYSFRWLYEEERPMSGVFAFEPRCYPLKDVFFRDFEDLMR